MQKTARAKNWCYPRVPRAEKGRPNGCWYKAALNPSQHPWAVWAREQGEERREKTAQSLAAPIGLKDDITDLQTSLPLDAINPTWSSFDFMALGTAATSRTVIQKLIPLATRDTSWRLGNYKSQARWKSQTRDRNWTKEKIDETLKKEKDFPH